jgi:hypothetical protein
VKRLAPQRVTSGALVFLAFLLPLVAIITAQADIDDSGDWWRQAIALVTIPIALAWLMVVLLLLWRAVRWLKRAWESR